MEVNTDNFFYDDIKEIMSDVKDVFAGDDFCLAIKNNNTLWVAYHHEYSKQKKVLDNVDILIANV